MLKLFLLLFSVTHIYSIEKIEVLRGQIEKNEPSWFLRTQAEDQFLQTPNLNFSSGGNRSRFFQIRGIGAHSQYDTFNSSEVGYFYEGIDLSENPQASFLGFGQDFFIHKTSQTSDWGGGAMGGMAELSHCSPEYCPRLRSSILINNSPGASLVLSVPLEISENWWVSFQGARRIEEGFQFNNFLSDKTGGRDESFYEIHQYFALEKLAIETHHLHSDLNNGYDHFSHNNNRITHSDRPGKESLDIWGHSLRLTRNWQSVAVSFLTSLSQSDFNQSFDEDWRNDEYWQTLPGWNQNYDYHSENQFKKTKWHNKLELDAKSWKLGIHAYQFEDELENEGFEDVASRGLTRGEMLRQGLALFSEVSLLSNSSKRMSLKARGDWQETQLISPQEKLDQNFFYSFETSYRQNLSFTEMNWTLGRSYRGGGYNLEASAVGERRSFEPETFYFIQSEFNELFGFNNEQWTLFYHFRENQQLRTSFQDDLNDPSSFTTITQNSGNSEAFGIEWEKSVEVDPFLFQISLGGLFSHFKEYQSPSGSLKGRQTPYAPLYSFRLLSRYQFTQNFNLEMLFYGKDEFYFSNSHNQKSTAFELLDLSFNYQMGAFSTSIFVKNLLDRTYAQRGFYFSNEPPTWRTELYTQPEPPRIFGVQISYFL